MAVCSEPGCPNVAPCQEHTRRASRAFTYSESWWRRWRAWFIGELVAQGISPTCGARLPGVAVGFLTQCQRDRQTTVVSDDGSSLHLHHEPELEPHELAAIRQGDRAIACDASRIVLACRWCHARETRANQ